MQFFFSWKIKSQFSVKKIVCKVQCIIYSWKNCNFIHEFFFSTGFDRIPGLWWKIKSYMVEWYFHDPYRHLRNQQLWTTHSKSKSSKKYNFWKPRCLPQRLNSAFFEFILSFNRVVMNYIGRIAIGKRQIWVYNFAGIKF